MSTLGGEGAPYPPRQYRSSAQNFSRQSIGSAAAGPCAHEYGDDGGSAIDRRRRREPVRDPIGIRWVR